MHRLLQSIAPWLDAHSQAGFPCFRGTRISGQIIASDGVLNRDFLSGVASWKLSIRCQDGGRVALLVFGRKTPLSADIVGIDSELTLTLKVPLLGKPLLWAFEAFVTVDYIRIEGRHIYVKIGSIPEVAAWRHVWKNRLSPTILTQAGSVIIRFVFEIT